MPPKPWETKNRAPSTNISQIIASNPTQKDDVVKQPPSGIASTQGGLSNAGSLNIANSTMSPGLSSMNSMGSYGGYGSSYGGYGSSYGGGYGSSYGGMGGYGGGYGSSYGGMGGYGSYGSSYGMGMGMGRYGMNGMNGQDQQNSFLNHTLMTLERFGYLINILCEIARSFDANYEGLHLFGNSFKSIGHKTSSGTSNGIKWLFNKIFSLLKIIFQFIKHNVFFMQNERSQERYKSVSRTLSILVIVFSISLYPLIRKGLKAV